MEKYCLMFISHILLLTGSQSARFIGCYKENSIESRLMPEELQHVGNLTPDWCIKHCSSKRFNYAGLQVGVECFCSNERPSFKVSADLSECNSKCSGDNSKLCGGAWRLSVYDLNDKGINHVQKNYFGCYKDDTCRILNKKFLSSNLNTPEFCAGICYRLGYRYSGVEFRFQCFCGDVINGPSANEDDCGMNCQGDNRLMCGGEGRISIYHTYISDENEDGRLVGCLIDSSARLLSGRQINLPETNTPRRCLNICKDLGFRYAGVQSGDSAAVTTNLGGQEVILASVYMPYEEQIPSTCLERLTGFLGRQTMMGVIGMDANAHHIAWGSSNTNNRELNASVGMWSLTGRN